MPNLPKPRLRRAGRARQLVAPPPEPAERKPNVETITAEGLRWVNIERPSPLECAWLEEQFGFDALEEEIFSGRSEEVVRDIFNVKQEIINFRKIIRPQRPVLRDLERTKQRYMREELEVYFDDIVDASERIWDMLENYKEVVEALEDTNESVISHRVNDILRVLTAFSVVVLPLTLLASLWGMNVGVPGEGDTGAFYVVIASMGTLLVAMVAYFRHRGWL